MPSVCESGPQCFSKLEKAVYVYTSALFILKIKNSKKQKAVFDKELILFVCLQNVSKLHL